MRRRNSWLFLLVVLVVVALFGVFASGCGGVAPQVQGTPTPTPTPEATPTPGTSPEPTLVVGVLIF